jgi:BirA family transcriptional regulator, biotin operon repressor / biotin---[acetyl-CoA-carboxylase] ligase
MLERFLHSQIDSTNLEAARLWRAGRALPCLVAADRQTSGRGRHGRTWESPSGGLWFSLLWPVNGGPEQYQGVTLSVGLAVAEAIEQACGLSCAVKWPNDLLARNRKLAGILCQLETSQYRWAIVAGVGINANFDPAALGPGVAGATSLLAETGREHDLEELTAVCAENMCRRLEEFQREGLKAHIPLLQKRLAWVGEEVEIAGDHLLQGRLVGVDEQGRLVVNVRGELRSSIGGELAYCRRQRGNINEG